MSQWIKLRKERRPDYEYIANYLELNKINLIKTFENYINSNKKIKKTNICLKAIIKIFYLLNLKFKINLIRKIYSKFFSLFF